jgi:hypothetical protein
MCKQTTRVFQIIDFFPFFSSFSPNENFLDSLKFAFQSTFMKIT